MKSGENLNMIQLLPLMMKWPLPVLIFVSKLVKKVPKDVVVVGFDYKTHTNEGLK